MHLLLAQGLEAADRGLSLLEKVQAGGVPLISLVLALVFGYFGYRQLRENRDQAKEHLDEVRDNGKASLSRQESLMREMLDRDRQSQETVSAAVTTISGFTDAIQDQQKSCDQTNVLAKDLLERIKGIEADLRRRAT